MARVGEPEAGPPLGDTPESWKEAANRLEAMAAEIGAQGEP